MYGRHTTSTHYCADASCDGFKGFPVTWAPDTEIDPAYPLTDTCPHCGHNMLDSPPDLDIVEEAVDALTDSDLLGGLPTGALDARAMLRAIQTEYEKQRKAHAERNRP